MQMTPEAVQQQLQKALTVIGMRDLTILELRAENQELRKRLGEYEKTEKENVDP